MHHCYGVGPVDFAGVRQNPLTQPLYMMVVQFLVARLSYDNSMLWLSNDNNSSPYSYWYCLDVSSK